jgi:hypothetical protein
MSPIPAEYSAENGVKLFNSWSFSEVEIKDVALVVSF